jgi:hypothetical protein
MTMPTFVMLTLNACDRTHTCECACSIGDKIRTEYPQVHWIKTVRALGPRDYLDVFTAPDFQTAAKVSHLIGTHEHCSTDLWPADKCPGTLNMIVASQ